MMNRVSFYGDGRLPNYIHVGHFEYGPEVNGIPSYGTVQIPRDLWAMDGDEYYRQWDHRHLLPWVPLSSEDKPCGQSRNEGQGSGVALVRHIGDYTTLGCWDYTGDERGNSWALFWVKGKLSAGDMIAAISRDFPRIWERITKPKGMQFSGQSDPDPEVAKFVKESTNPVSIDDAMPGLWERLFVDGKPTDGVRVVIEKTNEAQERQISERSQSR